MCSKNESFRKRGKYERKWNTFTCDGRYESAIERIENARFVSSRKVPRKARLAVHRRVLTPTLMYGNEWWVWQKKHEGSIALRSIAGVRLMGKFRNSVTSERCGVEENMTKIERGMFRWFGRVVRINAR